MVPILAVRRLQKTRRGRGTGRGYSRRTASWPLCSICGSCMCVVVGRAQRQMHWFTTMHDASTSAFHLGNVTSLTLALDYVKNCWSYTEAFATTLQSGSVQQISMLFIH